MKPVPSPRPERVLIVDGANNHDWRATTPVLRDILTHAGFDVTVSTCPPRGATDAAWNAYRPDFEAFDAVVSNYFDYDVDRPWPTILVDALDQYVANGGGLVVVHAGAAAFMNHSGFNHMIGLGWRGADFGHRITVDASGAPKRSLPSVGPGAGHGEYHAFDVDIHLPDHPAVVGVPRTFRHAPDELWHGLRGPARDMTILASAFSTVTGEREPILWTVAHGRGRVFVTVLGHDVTSMSGSGFQASLLAGLHWVERGCHMSSSS